VRSTQTESSNFLAAKKQMVEKIIGGKKAGPMAGPAHITQPANNIVEHFLNRIPGPRWIRVLVGTSFFMGFCGVTFFGGKKKKSGHGAFDTEKPEMVQRGQDSAESARLDRFSKSHK
jgi:hypothetical protein